ncbi:hypothetical protein KEM56_002879 [Ascosphaera pollenicola]|nr:hypothetical protein KEM56_002879 [Ascosphaera pollenicola]
MAAKEHYIRNFNLINIRDYIKEVTPEVAEDPIRMDFYETDTAKYFTNCKSETHTRMKRYLQILRSTSNILFVNRPDALYQLFEDAFLPEDLFQVFYWLKDVVDFTRSTETSQWFLKNVFINIAVKTELYLDLIDKGSTEATDFRQKMMLSWDRTMARYKDIREEDFVRPEVRVRVLRQHDNRDTERELLLFESDIIVTGRPTRE